MFFHLKAEVLTSLLFSIGYDIVGMDDLYNEDFFIMFIHESGGVMYVHNEVNVCREDFSLNLTIARDKAIQGSIVHILPEFNERDKRRGIIFFDAKPARNPDLRIDGVLYEVECPARPRKINILKHRIDDGANQADFVIIYLKLSIDLNHMRRVCKSRFIDHPELQRIEFKYKESYFVFNRNDFH